MAKKSIVESTQWIRDNEIISAFFLTGEVTRINAAKVLFANAFVENSTNKKDSTAIKIKSISVSLYGYDTGAALARKFLDELLEEFGNDSNLLIVFYVQIMPDDFVMQLHRF